ncbi:helix-turn-helix domain-containing protein [Streptococcus castoreus]|uniref:helix-turn-helix transcriptional regulator n=1 Tax=Streptococcus castoreus TaxID=254786 RepID=UPI00041F6684|nr:helix-turn-helix transcriptional regulator [Streptococcus castoreus]
MYNRLKELRKDKGLTQADLAKVINTNQSQYGKYENGKTSLSIENSKILADFFGVSIPYLLGFDNNSKIANSTNKDTNLLSFFEQVKKDMGQDYFTTLETLEKVSKKTLFNSPIRDRLEEIKQEKIKLNQKIDELEAEAKNLRKTLDKEVKERLELLKK